MEEPHVHPSAEVEAGAVVGAGSRVWRRAHIRGGAVIGSGCTLGGNVFVDVGVRVGDRVKIQNNAALYAGVQLEDEVFVGPGVAFTNDRHPRAIGEWQIVPTNVRRGASIGANATIVCGVEIGEGAMVGAGAVVTRDVVAYELVAGNPARRLGWVCSCGNVLARTTGPHPVEWRCPSCGRSSDESPAPISLHDVHVAPETERLVRHVLRSGQLAQGPMAAALEERWAAEVGVRHAVAVTSGTSALLLAFRALGIGAGDEVVTSPFTFFSTVSTIVETGATVRFADIADDATMSPESLESVISDRTRAVVPVHLYGLPAAMDRISSIAARHGIAIVEDAAQAAGARVGGRAVGSFGTGCFSLYATKNLTSGEGGMVTTDDGAVAHQVRQLRDHGRGPDGEHLVLGHNYRMTDLQAAVGVGQLDFLETENQQRRHNAAQLTQSLGGVRGLAPPPEPAGRTPVYSLYTVRVTAGARLSRDELADHLRRHGVETGVYYPRLASDQPAFHGHPQMTADPVPRAAEMAREVLSLPVHPRLSSAQLGYLSGVIVDALK